LLLPVLPSHPAVLFLLLAGGGATASAAVPVLGYQSEESPTSLIGRDAARLGSVGFQGQLDRWIDVGRRGTGEEEGEERR
jgi:hypothetical protein